MKVVITGGGGMLGFKLAKALLARGSLAGIDGKETAITRLTLFDTAFAATLPQDQRLEAVPGDISAAGVLAKVVTPDTGSIFHLASVVSAGAEADFDLGWRVNLDGARTLLELARRCARPPRFVFTSSVAAFGAWLALIGRIGPARASYVGVMVPVVALTISTVFENLPWHPLIVAGMAVSVAGNVLVLRDSKP